MKISCVIPTRDRVEMVAVAITSVLNQDQAGTEIVVVDDGSVDGTMSMLARRFPQVHRLGLPGLGPGAARNAGVAAASGELIMFLDSDDFWSVDHVRRLSQTIRRGYSVAYGTTKTIDQLAGAEFLLPEPDQVCEGACFAALLSWCFMVPSALAVRREAFVRVGGFSQQGLGEDWGLVLRLAQDYEFGFAGPEVITLRHLHTGSLCRLTNGATLISALTALRDLPWRPSTRPAAVQRFSQLLAWLAKGDKSFASVQEWYLALRADRML